MIEPEVIDITEQNETESFIDLTEDTPPVPLSDAELTAAISTLAFKNLTQAPDDQLKSKHDMYLDLALQREEDTIRGELVSLKTDKLLAMSDEMIIAALTQEDNQTVQDIIDLQFAFDPEAEKFTIVEAAAADQIIAEGVKDPDRAVHSIQDMELDTQSFEDVVQNTLTEKMLVGKAVKKYLNKLGWDWNTIGSGAQMLMPFDQITTFSQKIATAENPILTGNDIEEQIATFKAMSIPEKAKTLKALEEFFDKEEGTATLGEVVEGAGNDLAALTYFSYLNEFTGLDWFVENSVPFLDGTIVGAFTAKPLMKGLHLLGLGTKIAEALMAGKVATMAILGGNRISAVEQVHGVINGVRTGEIAVDSNTAANAAELLLEGQLAPISETITGSAGISGRVEKEIQRIEKTTQDILDTQQVRFLDPSETEEVLSLYRERVIGELFDAGLYHNDILRVVGDDFIEQGIEGTKYVSIYGDAFGSGFTSERIAKEYADTMKMDGVTITLKEVDGTHFIRLEKRVDNPGGFIKTYEGIDDAALGRAGGWRRVLGSPTNFIGDFEARAAHLTLATRENAMVHAKEMLKYVSKLTGKEKSDLGEVMELGRNKSTWFTASDLKNRFFLNDKQIVAYHALRRMDDINHIVLNSSEFNRKDRLGFKTLELTNEDALKKGLDSLIDAVPMDNIPNPGNKSIYNVSTGKYETALTPDKIEELRKKGYVFAELEGSRETDVLEPLNFIIGKAHDLRVKPLRTDQVEYRAGGRVEYQNEYFVKQGRIRKRSNNPIPILLKSKTYGVGTKEEAAAYVEAMNRGREVALRNRGADGKFHFTEEAGKLMDEATGGRFKSIRVFVDHVGEKNLEMPFEVVKDGEELTAVREAVSLGANTHPADTAEINSVQRMIARGGDQKSHRGFGLTDFNGDPAPVINPLESASKSLDRAIELMSHDTWRQRQAQKFVRTFGPVLKDLDKKSPMGHFLNPEYIDNPNEKLIPLVQKAQRMEQHFKVVMNTPTSKEKFIKENMIHPLVDIFESVSKKIGKPMKVETVNNLKAKDPIGFIRSLSYNANLGLFNLRQPAIQAQATLLMMAASPKHGARGAWLGLPMRLMLASENPQTLAAIARGAGKVVGLKGEQVMELHDILQKTGTWRLKAGGLAEQELKGLSSANIFQKFLDAGTVPFMETERYNKVSATMAAALEWREANPTAKITEAVIDEIRTKSEFFTANMNRVDRAEWQRGIASMPTQFWGYQARALEMMLPEMAGGSRHFTTGQKWRMRLTQLALYGVGGTTSPRYGLRFRDSINEMYKETFKDEEGLPEVMLDGMEKGMIESFLANALGIDVAFSHRAGLGLTEGGWGEVATKLATMDVEEILKIDAAGMSTLAKASEGMKNIFKLLNPSSEYFGTIEQLEGLKAVSKDALRRTVSSFNGIERAYIAARYGMHVDKLGNTTDRAASMSEVVLGILGLDPSLERDKRVLSEAVKGGDSYRETTIRVLARELNLAMKSGDFDNFLLARKFMFSILDEEERRNINQAVLNKSKDKTTSIMMRYMEKFNVHHDLNRGQE
jgi:hypothetical protein